MGTGTTTLICARAQQLSMRDIGGLLLLVAVCVFGWAWCYGPLRHLWPGP